MNKIICSDCVAAMNAMDAESVDMALTSPPYDDLRKYDGEASWDFNATVEAL